MSDSRNSFFNSSKNSVPFFNREHKNPEQNVNKPQPSPKSVKPPKNHGFLKKTKEEPKVQIDISPSLGALLQEARVKAEYSLSQVAMITKLNIHYIEAIERNDFDNAPPYIYVRAYVKKLSELYSLDQANALNLLKPFGGHDKIVSDSILQELEESKQINEKEEKKIVFYIKIASISFIVAVLFAVILYFCFGGSDSSSPKVSGNSKVEKQIVINKMEKLIVPQTLTPSELKVPGTGKK
jgi:hypothetical protein